MLKNERTIGYRGSENYKALFRAKNDDLGPKNSYFLGINNE
jgi:hypothetical protein